MDGAIGGGSRTPTTDCDPLGSVRKYFSSKKMKRVNIMKVSVLNASKYPRYLGYLSVFLAAALFSVPAITRRCYRTIIS